MKFTRLVTAVGIILITASVLAAPANRPCREDIQKNCSGTIGDRQAMGQCIRENFEKLSEQCQAAVTRRMEERRAAGGRPNTPSEDEGSAEDQ